MRIFASSSAWLASAVLHLTGFGVVAFGPRPALAPARVTVELTVATVTPPPQPPPPPPPPIVPEVPRAALSPKAPAPTRAARPTSARVESAPPVATSPEPPAPLDLTGTTLTAERGDFAMAVGTGGFGTGGGGGGARPAVVVAPAGAAAGPALARHEDLSRLPAPPELSDALLAHYPARARAAGETGRATLSLIVYQDGTVGGIEVRSATSVDFAAACRETVRGSHWAPPVSKDGRATATRVGYTCHFDVR